jgi:uncharacterized protein YbjQ (UPF0145 family)
MDASTYQMIDFAIPLFLLVFAYFLGTYIERRHFRNIREREKALHGFPVTTIQTLPETWQVEAAELVSGNVVVSLDYFKRVVAGLRSLIGGRVKTYEPLLDRARREALLRMVEQAKSNGFDAVANVRLETSRLANSRGDGKGIAGVEMLAFGTALKLSRR